MCVFVLTFHHCSSLFNHLFNCDQNGSHDKVLYHFNWITVGISCTTQTVVFREQWRMFQNQNSVNNWRTIVIMKSINKCWDFVSSCVVRHNRKILQFLMRDKELSRTPVSPSTHDNNWYTEFTLRKTDVSCQILWFPTTGEKRQEKGSCVFPRMSSSQHSV